MIRSTLLFVAVTACLLAICDAVPIILAAPKSVSPSKQINMKTNTQPGLSQLSRLAMSPLLLRTLLDIDGFGAQGGGLASLGLQGEGHGPYNSYILRDLLGGRPRALSAFKASPADTQAMPSQRTSSTLGLSPLLLRTLLDIDGYGTAGAMSALGIPGIDGRGRGTGGAEALAAYGGLTQQDILNLSIPAALNYPTGLQLFTDGYNLGGPGSLILG